MQQKIKQLSLAVPSLALLVAVASAGPALAARADHGNAPDQPDGPPQNVSQLQEKGNQMVATLRSERKTQRTTAARQQLCETHKQGLETRAKNIVKAAQGFQSRIDTIYSEAQAYQQTSGATVSNWDALVAAADTAKTDSTDAVTALAAVQPSLDCNSDSVAQDVATFKAAATQARDELKTYKADVRAVVQALETGKDGAKPGSTDTNTNTTDTTTTPDTTTTTTDGGNQ